jgi:hypothetical protein
MGFAEVPSPLKHFRLPVYLGVVLNQPLDRQVSADTSTLLEPSRWASYWRWSDPRQFVRNHKLRVHDSHGAASIHEKVPSHCTQCRIALIKSRFPCLGSGASASSHSAFLFVRHMVGSSAFEAFRHRNRAQRLAGIRYLGVWVMEYGCLILYAHCDVTHTRLRVSGTHPPSVCLCKLTRARASLGRTLGSMDFSRNTIQLTFGRRRSPGQSATQLESNNQRSSSTSPGLSPRWYKQPYP